MPRAYKHVKDEIVERIEKGEYLLGDLVMGKSYSKLVMVDGDIQEKTFTIEGRRIPLEEIRMRIYKEHQELGNFF